MFARLDRPPTSYHLGYVLGPRVNAGGRIGRGRPWRAPLGHDRPAEAAQLAKRLDDLNTDRREIEGRVRDAALAQAEARDPAAALVWARRGRLAPPASSASSPRA